MFGSVVDVLAFRRVFNHRTYCSRMGSTTLNEFTVLVFDKLGAAVSLPFQVHRLQMLVEAGLIAFSNACFGFADEGPEKAQHGSLVNLPKILTGNLHGLSNVALVEFCA